MKTLLITLLHLSVVFCCFSQTETQLDTLITLKQSQQKVFIRCGTTFNDNRRPLLIVDGMPVEWDSVAFNEISPIAIESVRVLENTPAISLYGSLAKNGVVLIDTKANMISDISERELPFKVHKIYNDNWTQTQDVYNSIQANVPSVSVNNSNSTSIPNIRIRGDDNTIVIVDGVRCDVSILNVLNPSDIESVKVSNSVAAETYFRSQ